ncbi:MAG: metallophosphoesterase [Pseudomonadota bacterium]|nr:metallophosphoesterase [Pseudomonadota bacterium]
MSNNNKPSDRDIVLVHSSDIHVDDGYTARANAGDGTAPLQSVLRTSEKVGADILMLAGDTFEHNRLAEDIVISAASHLSQSKMQIVILPGNHDPAITDSPWHHQAMLTKNNIHIFGVTHKQLVVFKNFDLAVWGKAHQSYDDMKPLIKPRKRTAKWNIVMAHGHYEPVPDRNTALRPSWLIGDEDLLETGADYVALGHWNRPLKVGNESIRAYYSGSPDLAETVNVVRLKINGEVIVRRHKIV